MCSVAAKGHVRYREVDYRRAASCGLGLLSVRSLLLLLFVIFLSGSVLPAMCALSYSQLIAELTSIDVMRLLFLLRKIRNIGYSAYYQELIDTVTIFCYLS